MDEDHDMLFKIVLIGDSGVGKSNIMSRYIRDEFKHDSKATIGVEYSSKKYEYNGTIVKAQIWDTAGQERYRSLISSYYKGARGALLVYDVGQMASFENIDTWIIELKQMADQNVVILLIGNKCDLIDERQVTAELGEEKAKLHSIYFLIRYCIFGNFCLFEY
jgi:small GTP-binding protein